jgi:uncharacterized protein YdeI (YjbR/CyaY-like superfamily)
MWSIGWPSRHSTEDLGGWMLVQHTRTMPSSRLADIPRVEPVDRAAWRAWLTENHATSGSVWLVSWKAGRGQPRLAYRDAVEEALCFGWIDSLPRKLDDDRTMLLMSPRKKNSAWSALNKERALRMIATGQMTEAGQRVVDAARESGLWDKLEAVDQLVIPPDLEAALSAIPTALANFQAFPRSTRRGILEWILQAKRPETRVARISETARLAGVNQRANQWRGRQRAIE